MCYFENTIMYEMKKDGNIKIVSEEQVEEYKRNGYKIGKKVDLGGK